MRTLSSHLAYYQRWAKTWEFQALLKARPVAGDLELGEEYVDAVAPLVWQAAERENFVADVQKMRRRVVDNIPAAEVDRELKLGPGGLRDVEFAVQLLQLVHGRSDASLRSGTTLDALRALAAGGYVGRADAAQLDDAYRFLRVHGAPHPAVPAAAHPPRPRGRGRPAAPRPLARAAHRPGRRAEPGVEAARVRGAAAAREALLPAAARRRRPARPRRDPAQRRGGRGSGWTPSGTPIPAAALRHLEALASGVTRKAAIQRTLLPVLLGWFADSADPDAGLLDFRKVSDALGKTPWYLRLLRDEGAAAENLARVLSAGRLAPDLLLRAPEAVALLGDAARACEPRGRDQLEQEILAAVGRADTARAGGRRGPRGAPPGAVPYRRRRHRSARTAPRTAPPRRTRARSSTGSAARSPTSTPATLAGALRAAVRERWGDTLPTRFAVIGMGRFGGHELGYGSDADVLFVHEPREGVDEQEAARAANAVVAEMRRLLQLPTRRPAAAHRRRPAPGGQDRPAGPHADLLRGVLPALVAGLGEPGAAAGRSRGGRRGAGAPLHRADRPAALPGGGARRRRRTRDPPAEGPDGVRAACRAAPTRRCTPSWAAAV